MQRSHIQPSNVNNHKLYIARERYWRWCQLWHAARLACGDDTQFKAACPLRRPPAGAGFCHARPGGPIR
jgi:hypothetical protein